MRVERNALRANLVDQAQDWRWCSLWRKLNGDRESLMSAWPLDRPENWVDWVNGTQTESEIDALRKCVNRGTPYGSEAWKTRIANALGLESSLQPRGRRKKAVA
jgi:putative transposase